MPQGQISLIQQSLLSSLPGKSAQLKMSPPSRGVFDTVPANVRHSAVCVLLYYKKNDLHTILIKRTDDGKTHGGQISFPGGRLDDNDFSLTYCAQRECQEEIGLDLINIQVLGRITDLYIPPSNFLVTPIICFANSIGNLQASPDEVAEILEVPLMQLFDDNIKKTYDLRWHDHKPRSMQTPIYKLNEHIIWGATAMMLSEFEEIYRRVSTPKDFRGRQSPT